MAVIIGVRFKNTGKVYYFDPGQNQLEKGSLVVVETARGIECGEVVIPNKEVADSTIVKPLKPVLRPATPEDKRRAKENAEKEQRAMRVCQEKIAAHKLDMKLVDVEYTFDNSKILFYFTADGRVDFRDLVKDLASVFRTRIELRQIGVRDEAKMLGGLGICGRPFCCSQFLSDFQPVSIKMAKEQNLSLNPTKISGLCGRLMCCLKYEQDTYEQTLKRIPRVGKDIVTPDGVGVIAEINAIKEMVKVRIRTADDSFDVREYPIDDVRRPGPGDSAAVREQPKPQEKRPPRRAEPEPESTEEEPKKKRYPHQKAPKNLSTDQFLEKMKEDAERFEDEAEPSETPENRERKRRRRGGKGRHRSGEGAENAAVELSGSVETERAEAPKAEAADEFSEKPAEVSKAVETPAEKPAEESKAAEKPAEAAKAVEAPVEKPAEASKPAESAE